MILGLCGQAGVGKDAVADVLVKNHKFTRVAFADVLKRICRDVFGFSKAQCWGPSELRNAPDMRWPRGPQAYRDAAEREFQKGREVLRAAPTDDALQQAQILELAENHFKSALNYAAEGWLTPRYALQQLGSEWGRRCSSDTWVRYVLEIHERMQTGDYTYDACEGLQDISLVGDLVTPKVDIVISDVRFKNEVDAIQHAGGKVVRITRKGRPDPPSMTWHLNRCPVSLAELVAVGQRLSQSAAGHISETEQMEISPDVFDYHLINGGMDLALLEAAVAGLAAELRPT